MSSIRIRDVSRAGHPLGSAQVEGLPSSVSFGQLLRARVRAETEAYNADPGPLYTGLVQPSDAMRHRDGHHLARPRPLDIERLVAAAQEAVTAGILALRMGDELITDLSVPIAVDEHDEVVAVLQRPVIARNA